MMTRELVMELQALGLNGRQAGVYLALLHLGSASAIELAKETKYKHPTVYDVLDVLKERHLASETFSGGRRLFTAEPPDALQSEQNTRQKTLDGILPELRGLYAGRGCRPSVKYYHGGECWRNIHSELLSVKTKEYFYFGAVQEMFRNTGEEVQKQYTEERVRNGIRSYAIRVRDREVGYEYMRPGERYLRKVRYLRHGIEGETAGLYLYDGKIAVISGRDENFAMSIESPELFRLVKAIWDNVWESAEEP